jgi:hypothetical protein
MGVLVLGFYLYVYLSSNQVGVSFFYINFG